MISVCPVLKSLPQIGAPVFFESSCNAGISTVRFGAPFANGNAFVQRGVGVDLRRRDRRIVLEQSLLEGLDRLVAWRLLEEDLRRSAPDHHLPVGLALERLDVVAHLLRQIALGAARLHMVAVQALHIVLAEDRRHRLDALEIRLDLLQMIALEHRRRLRCLVHVLVIDIPAGKDDVVQLRQRHKVLDQRCGVVGPLAQPDGAHLRHRSDRLRKPAAHCLHASNQRSGHRTHPYHHDSQFALRGRYRLRSGGVAAVLLARHLVGIPLSNKPAVDQRPSLTVHPGFGKWEKLSGRSQPVNGAGILLNEFDRQAMRYARIRPTAAFPQSTRILVRRCSRR